VVTTGSTRFEAGVAGEYCGRRELEVEGVSPRRRTHRKQVEFGDGNQKSKPILTPGNQQFDLRGLPGTQRRSTASPGSRAA